MAHDKKTRHSDESRSNGYFEEAPIIKENIKQAIPKFFILIYFQ